MTPYSGTTNKPSPLYEICTLYIFFLCAGCPKSKSPPRYKKFEVELDERIQASYKMFAQSDESNMMYRMQGQIHALNALKQLRLKVNAND